MTEMSPVSNRSSIRYLENFSVDEGGDATGGAPAAAPESFQNEATQQKTHSHSKEKVEQNESSNDASNETSDSENGGAHGQKPLTSRNLEAQNKGNSENSGNGDSSASNSHPDGEKSSGNSNGHSGISTEATSTNAESNSKPALPKKFFCKVCNQGFTRKHNMVSHEMIHTTIKLHSCKNCNLSFRRIHDLKRHEKLHTGEKPFHCENCDRSFVRPDALTRHLNSPHACSGSKDMDESPHRTQTSNNSSSSYQASKLQHTIDSSGNSQRKSNHSHGTSKMLPSLANTFNEEQSLPLGSESSSASLLPTGTKSASSDGDSAVHSSGADRTAMPGAMAGSNLGYYAGSSTFSGDSNDSANNRPNFEINRWRSQQMHKGEQVSENIVRDIMQKHPYSSNSTSVNSGGDELKTSHDSKTINPPSAQGYQQQHPAIQEQQSYLQTYSPYHRSSASMAALNKSVIQASGLGRTPLAESQSGSQGTKSTSLPEVKATQNDGSLSGKDGSGLSQPSPSYHTGHESYMPRQSQGQYYLSMPMMQPNAPVYGHGSQSRSYLPMVPNHEEWQGSQQIPPNQRMWPDTNGMRYENHEHKESFAMSPEFVRAEAYHELQTHANSLQMRVTSLEQRMEMLEDKMKRDIKDNIKHQKRQEKKAKKKSKKTSTK